MNWDLDAPPSTGWTLHWGYFSHQFATSQGALSDRHQAFRVQKYLHGHAFLIKDLHARISPRLSTIHLLDKLMIFVSDTAQDGLGLNNQNALFFGSKKYTAPRVGQ